MANVFFSYSHKDEALRDELEVHLAMLKREGALSAWHDRKILAGDEFNGQIHARLSDAQVILLLVSPDFLASAYCYDVEMTRAMELHVEGRARVIPVILRPSDWKASVPLARLLAVLADVLHTWKLMAYRGVGHLPKGLTAKADPFKRDVLDRYVQDSACGTWELLANAVHPGGATAIKKVGWPLPGQLKHEWAEKIGPFMSLHQNASPSFGKFRDGLSRLIA